MALDTLKLNATAELVRFVEEEASGFPAIRWVWQALQTRGKLLGPQCPFCWGMLPPLCSQAVGGDPRKALLLSVAVECAITAADVLDDIQDQDASDALWRSCGIATATNTATYLLFLAQLALARLRDQEVSPDKIADLALEFASAGATACCGQQKDLDLSAAEQIDGSTYLSRIAEKSASLARWACRSGAVLGSQSPPPSQSPSQTLSLSQPSSDVEALSEFGYNVGMALQISNDLVGTLSESNGRADLRRGKRTIPIIFALECAPEPIRRELTGLLGVEGSDLDHSQIDRAKNLITASGAVLYTTVVADVFWERALSLLEQMEESRASPLKELVGRMRRGWQG